MQVQTLSRRVCGEDKAIDFFIERALSIAEIEELANRLQGRKSAFGALFYLDFELGRLTASTNSLRCTLRTKYEGSKLKEEISDYLQALND